MWTELNDEQKTCYGEDYYEAAMTSCEKYSREVSNKILYTHATHYATGHFSAEHVSFI